MKKNKEALIIFARNPVKGKVKTRLAKTIGDDKALEVYNRLLEMTYATTKVLSLKKFIFYTDIPDQQIFDSSYGIKIQSEGDLGERMINAFKNIFSLGFEKVVIAGVDCPGLNSKIIMQAFDSLDEFDFVFGPAEDGGYYLAGMKNRSDFIFKDINWGTKSVLENSITKIKNRKLKYYLLETLTDIDTAEDLLKAGSLLDN